MSDDEIEELKKIVEKFMKDLRGIEDVRVIFGRHQEDGLWKVVARYPTKDNPDMLSMLIINIAKKKVEYFRENIQHY